MAENGVDGRRRSTSLRRLLAILLGVIGLLVGALLIVASRQVSGSAAQTRAENRSASSFLLADSLRQSSNDLTNMVRLYVATGRPRYRAYYQQILAIRAGTSPRPLNYDSSFWDRVLASGEGSVRYGPAQSLIAQMRAAHFAPVEFRALQAALDASNHLARLERSVMTAAARIARRDRGADYPAAVAPLYQRLVDHAYLVQKGVIMAAVQRFIALVDARTSRDVQQAQAHNRNLVRIEIAILVAIVLAGIAAMAILTRLVLRPLDRLIRATRRVAAGDYSERVDVRAVSELERVAGAFNSMAAAIEADVAARKRAEGEAVAARSVAEHASRAKSTFLAAMSHEIRTPMIGVTGMLEVLARTHLTPQQRQMVSTAEGSAASLLQIIGDILDFSKIEADKLELSPTTFSLETVVRAAAETFVHTASAKGLLLTWSVDDTLAPAQVGDPLRVRQIVSNLISNAVKFTEVGGIEVTVGVLESSAHEQTVEVTVSDTGIGISPEQQSGLFAEFTQADAETQSRYGGSGLGLVICQRLAALMGGDITLESTLGTGTTMRLVAPLPVGNPDELRADLESAATAPATSRPMPSREQAERERSLLLLAEDHPTNRTVLRQQLTLIGFHVDLAEDGQEAYEHWLTGRYGLLLTDLNMPRLDGYELARQIRAREHETGAARTPIIALSANVMQGEPDKCLAAGMDDFAAKPTTIPTLAGRLARWLPHLTWASEEPERAELLAPATASRFGWTDGLVDAAALDALTGGDAELAASLVQDYLEVTRSDLQALCAALDARDMDDACRQAHRIKGAARTVGAHEIARLADQIEAATATGGAETPEDWDALDALADQITRDLGPAIGSPHDGAYGTTLATTLTMPSSAESDLGKLVT
jgi:signal transduction histidine kinase/CheY-like chemotaxis protein/HPt (histidine-containing phosphotransfer) domain-containing protein